MARDRENIQSIHTINKKQFKQIELHVFGNESHWILSINYEHQSYQRLYLKNGKVVKR